MVIICDIVRSVTQKCQLSGHKLTCTIVNQALRRLHFETIVFEVLEQGWYLFQFASVCFFAFTLSFPFKMVILIERCLHWFCKS